MKSMALVAGLAALLFAGAANADMSLCGGADGSRDTGCGLEQAAISAGNPGVVQLGMVPPPPPDTVLTYNISPTITLPQNVYSSDTISGSFVYDVTSGTLQSVSLTVSGSYMPGTYNTTANGYNNANDDAEISSCRAGNCSVTSAILHLWFQNNLGNASDPVADVSWDAAALSAPTNRPNAIPMPEPASLGLLGGGLLALAGLGVARRRRRLLTAS